MKTKTLILLIITACLFYSCEELLNLNDEENKLSQKEIVDGLKTALELGADSAVTGTSKLNGFYGDQAIKILLPPEADIIVDNMNHPALQAIGIDKKIEDVILRINRSAEKAASGAKDIFVDAITGMTITDGLDILYGTNPLDSLTPGNTFDSTAATGYLKIKTYENLKGLFKPMMNLALDEDIVAGLSTNDAWDILQEAYNTVARNPLVGVILGWEEISVNLSDHTTGKALDGLFLKIENEETKIRENPLDWAINIIQKVFNYVKNNPRDE